MSARISRRLATDPEGGFIDLVEAHGSMVLSIGTRLGDPHAAEDVVQETFLRAWNALESAKVDPECLQLRPWLATIALNLVRNEGRRRSRKPTAELSVGVAASVRSSEPAPDEEVVHAAGDGPTALALAALPELQREAVVLRHVADLSTAEAAEAMGCPTGTLKSHLSRGLAALRAALEEADTEDP